MLDARKEVVMATAIERRAPAARGALLVAALVGLLLGGILGAAITATMRSTAGEELTAPRPAIDTGRTADGLRYQGLAEAHARLAAGVARGRAADALRYQALGAARPSRDPGSTTDLTRGQIADGLRYRSLAESAGS
jgi:hypothetical protein